jgi:hypothetical protein
MNHTPDTTAAGNGGNFDPQQAAALLDQTERQARRQLQPFPPWLLVFRAVLVLAAFGAIWLSVRGQHPYKGPTAAAFVIVVLFVLIHSAVTFTVAKRATTGVTGRSRLRPAEITILAAAWIVPFVVMAVLADAGTSPAIVWGLYPITLPLISAGLAWAGITAGRAQWRRCGTGLAVAVVGAAGLAAGAPAVWLVVGVGLCAVLLAGAAITAWQQRHGLARA